MKRLIGGLLALLLLCLSGCGRNPAPIPDNVQVSAEELLTLVVTESANYRICDGGIQKRPGDWLVRGASISHLQVLDGVAYYVTDNDSEHCALCRVSTDGGTPETVFTRADLGGQADTQINTWQFHNGRYYVQMNLQLFVYDPATGQGRMVNEDVGCYALDDNFLYHIDHAGRTFTVYRTDLTTGQQEILLGDGTYEGKSSGETLYKHFCLLDGVLYYTTKRPSGLYRYENGQNTLISSSDAINEFSLCTDNGSIYYVERADNKADLKEYDPATGNVRQVVTVSDFSRFAAVRHACFFYYDLGGTLRRVDWGTCPH